jgi:hypothetical protein
MKRRNLQGAKINPLWLVAGHMMERLDSFHLARVMERVTSGISAETERVDPADIIRECAAEEVE